MAAKGFTVDLDKPIVSQVGYLGEAYEEWVHQPVIAKQSPRFFESDFLELLTRTEWWVIPVVWLPVACWFISRSVQMGLMPPLVALSMIYGVFLWTLVEYILHRFIFHMPAKTFWGNTMHYLIHGYHHKHPMDRLRLVFPPAETALVLVPLWHGLKLISTPSTAPAIFGGGLMAYVVYDLTHFYLHHGKSSKGFVQNLKTHHLNHHFKVQNMGFGVTSSLWDKMFGTIPQPKYSKEK